MVLEWCFQIILLTRSVPYVESVPIKVTTQESNNLLIEALYK